MSKTSNDCLLSFSIQHHTQFLYDYYAKNEIAESFANRFIDKYCHMPRPTNYGNPITMTMPYPYTSSKENITIHVEDIELFAWFVDYPIRQIHIQNTHSLERIYAIKLLFNHL